MLSENKVKCIEIERGYLKECDSIVPPIIKTISWVSFISGSKPMLPPGDDSNIKPKS